MLLASLLLALTPAAHAAPLPAPAAPLAAQAGGTPIETARSLLDEGSAEQAVAELTALLESSTDADLRREAVVLLAEAHVALGQAEAAVQALNSVTGDLDPHVDLDLAYAGAFLAWADERAQEPGHEDDVKLILLDALSSYEAARERAPDGDHRALVGEGYMHLYRYGDYQRALEMAGGALEQTPDDAELLLLRGCAGVYDTYNLNVAGDTEAADAAWNLAVSDLRAAADKLPRERLEPWGQLAYLYESRGDGVQAVRAAIEIVDRQSDPNLDNLYRLAKQYSYQRNWNASSLALQKMCNTSAIELTRRVREEPERDAVATELSWSVGPFVQRNDRASALNILRALTRADIEAVDVWHNFAVMLDETNAASEARAAYEKRIELDPENPRAYNDLASLLHRSLSNGDDAEQVRERARELYAKCIELAESQIADENVDDTRKAEARTAMGLARNSLDEITPKTPERALGGLLDGLLEGLGDAAGEGEDEGADETSGGGAGN